jgi:CubicO group peptidase (beta-lactamase class C family)
MSTPGAIYAIEHLGTREISVSGLRHEIGCALPKAMNEATSFDVASLTKILFTTNLYMRMVDEKTVQLNDAVSRYLPEWKTSDKGDIRIHDLLTHRSGLEPWRPLYISCEGKESARHFIAINPLKAKLGEQRIYSDLGFIALGEIAETIFSTQIDEIFQNQIKSTLNLESTQFAKPRDKENVAATSLGDEFEKSMVETDIPYVLPEKVKDFTNWRSEVLVGEINDGNSFHVFNGVSSHAGLFSTANDLLSMCDTYLKSFRDAGFFHSSTIRQFVQGGADPMQGLGFRNWKVKTRFGVKTIFGHTGFTGVAMGFIPDLDFAAIMLTNRLHTKSEPPKTEELWLPFLESSLSKI